ncbi:MAG: lipopolysaccharide biosynthesis protein [Actinobacteria bacterium]|nr:lipopolysaccharide biosynthesis protein [Actinomycetota bacterium]
MQAGEATAADPAGVSTVEPERVLGAPRIPSGPAAWVRSALVGGRSSLTVGLLFDGVASYVFLSAAARELGPDRFTLVSMLWVVLFLVGNGLFIPVEQELSRSIASRAARGSDWSALVRRVAIASGAVLAVALALGTIARGHIADSLFRGRTVFVGLLLFGLVGVWLMFLLRGILSGEHRFHGYGLMFAADALAKAIPGIALLWWGAWRPSSFGFIVSGSAYAGIVVAWLALRWGRRRPEPEALLRPGGADIAPPWGRLTTSMGFLLLTSFLSALAINIGTVSIEVLGNRVDADKAGIFLSGLVIARIPLFLFQAIQAIVLPRLSRLAALGDLGGFRADLRRLNVAMGACTTVAVLGAAAIGPLAVRILFGDEYALLGARDMALLTLASMLMTAALTLNQAQIALHHQRQTGWPWGVATAAFLAVTVTNGRDLFLRVELGMVAAGAVAFVVVALLVHLEMRHPDELRTEIPTL